MGNKNLLLVFGAALLAAASAHGQEVESCYLAATVTETQTTLLSLDDYVTKCELGEFFVLLHLKHYRFIMKD